jgi:murein L,D-transpeptidase YafK
MRPLTASLEWRAAFRTLLLVILACSLAWSAGRSTALPPGMADRILVVKSARTMTLMRDGKVLKTYKVALSGAPVGPKEREGDHRVPEGRYVVDSKNLHSRFHLALHISYPNVVDQERARKAGVKPGGNIEIHGLGSAFGWVGSLQRQIDWTDGCIAVNNSEIEEIWALVRVGTPVEIRP